MTFLHNLLKNNYQSCATQVKESDAVIRKCALILEEKAARSCMIVSLYRKSILQIIANIREETKQTQLNECIAEEFKLVETRTHIEKVDAFVQTDPPTQHRLPLHELGAPGSVHHKSLDEKLRIFEMKLKEDERKRKQFAHYLSKKQREKEHIFTKKLKMEHQSYCVTPTIANTPESLPPPATPPALFATPQLYCVDTDIEDDITKELHEIFGTNNDQLDPVEEIFGESISIPTDCVGRVVIPLVKSDPSTSVAVIAPQSLERIASPPRDYAEELNNSIWPCELHRQRLHLHQVLENISEKGWRHNDKVKRRFLQLFGEDDDDEFGPYSPSLAMNDVLMASCKKRIAPWIVKALMTPMKDGLIANRFLFKKVAKSIAEAVIAENQYPGTF